MTASITAKRFVAVVIRTNSYFGQPFIFNDLSNFGGNPGLFGHIETVNKGPAKSRMSINGKNSTMVGTGYTMEGLDLTYPTVDLVIELYSPFCRYTKDVEILL